MKSHRLPYIQSICLDLYINCKLKSKKDHSLPITEPPTLTADEQLVYNMLKNSSITESNPDSPRCFTKVNSAIYLMCRQLCPGQWCTRTHCKSYSGHCAYHCGAGKRPATCNLYRDYIEKKKRKEDAQGNN
jgi:hypothetical protein